MNTFKSEIEDLINDKNFYEVNKMDGIGKLSYTIHLSEYPIKKEVLEKVLKIVKKYGKNYTIENNGIVLIGE